MSLWWNALTAAQQIFYGIAFLGTFLVILQTILLTTGVHLDHQADLGSGDSGHPSGLHILSIRTLVAFLAGFGWAGVVALACGGSLNVAIMAALLVGLGMAYSILALMRGMSRLTHDGTINYRNAIGLTATVYITIPPAGATGGQVEAMIQGRLAVVSAITQNATALASGTIVRVVDVATTNALIVAPQ